MVAELARDTANGTVLAAPVSGFIPVNDPCPRLQQELFELARDPSTPAHDRPKRVLFAEDECRLIEMRA